MEENPDRSPNGEDARSAQPSTYELEAWRLLHAAKPVSPLRGSAQRAKGRAAEVISDVFDADRVPPAVSDSLKTVGRRVSDSRRAVAAKVPEPARAAAQAVGGWTQDVVEGGLRALGRVGTVHLNPERVVESHRRRGHAVEALHHLRSLDLELVDAVKPRHLDLRYEFSAAVSGVGAGLVISGAEITGLVLSAPTGGAATAPTFGAISAALGVDAAATLSLCAGVVGHIALYYGYDVARPEERLFVMSVINLGSAKSAKAKYAAFSDISRLTQGLARKATWKTLNQSPLSQVANNLSKVFGTRLTKKGLAKAVPVAGVVAGAALNWHSVERIADAAEYSYRRRFLLEKYPELDPSAGQVLSPDGDDPGPDRDPSAVGDRVAAPEVEVEVSVVDMAIEAGVLEPDDFPALEPTSARPDHPGDEHR